MKIIVGLGNPGPKYVGTRHNIGHMAIEEIARTTNSTLARHKTRTLQASAFVPGMPGLKAIIATCECYMNLSGGPVCALLDYYNATPADLLVIHDDLDLEPGTLRLKQGGGEGGHNGLKSISQALGTRDYQRLRCGIGRPPGRQDPADFVLRPFGPREDADVLAVRAADVALDVVVRGFTEAQMRLHSEK